MSEEVDLHMHAALFIHYNTKIGTDGVKCFKVNVWIVNGLNKNIQWRREHWTFIYCIKMITLSLVASVLKPFKVVSKQNWYLHNGTKVKTQTKTVLRKWYTVWRETLANSLHKHIWWKKIWQICEILWVKISRKYVLWNIVNVHIEVDSVKSREDSRKCTRFHWIQWYEGIMNIKICGLTHSM